MRKSVVRFLIIAWPDENVSGKALAAGSVGLVFPGISTFSETAASAVGLSKPHFHQASHRHRIHGRDL